MDAAGLTVPESNGKNPLRGMSLFPHMLSDGKTSVPERTMIFELWGNIGVRRGDYKLWASVGRDYSPDWDALEAEISQKDLFDHSIISGTREADLEAMQMIIQSVRIDRKK